ncbi:PLC-like phosphodiesterase, TIM beta/alpha-barrel domain [Pseudocohnilembus persalinus]|uniref:PLC-like phosphodiesterase, TIM beta/alpha-barrel domain n=1 Tax=Pseudocohnilembus persalinus TaxID=266149 RepID=A0A0V0QVU8_PSEPJ|nr:PLC-like phosphodiesterase, TIM beta/alpha-barrel domain [Pseudocohnilembus persalinus]|eukprot:KRX06340.1 PLC-like phosphodiesterase, TIM beta/alpha-barrel domain [Pseudocohnilembus persalinus]
MSPIPQQQKYLEDFISIQSLHQSEKFIQQQKLTNSTSSTKYTISAEYTPTKTKHSDQQQKIQNKLSENETKTQDISKNRKSNKILKNIINFGEQQQAKFLKLEDQIQILMPTNDLTTTQPQKKQNKHKITILLYISLFIISLYLITLDRADYRLAPNYSVFYEKTKQQTLNKIQGKCSHNSYDYGNYYRQLSFDEEKPYQGGSLMLEFDIMHDIDEDKLQKFQTNSKEFSENSENKQQLYTFYMSHMQRSHTGESLQSALSHLKQYSQDHKNHLPIFVTLNIKPQLLERETYRNQFFYSLEQSILQVIGKDQIYTPAQLLNGEKNLFEAIQKNGYPETEKVLGKFIFILDAEQTDIENQIFIEFYKSYVNNNIDKNILFGTLDARLIQFDFYDNIKEFMQKNNQYNQIFVNIKASYFYDNEKQAYLNGLKVLKEAQELQLFTRGFGLNDKYQYLYYRDFQMNFLCTDHIFSNNYASAY